MWSFFKTLFSWRPMQDAGVISIGMVLRGWETPFSAASLLCLVAQLWQFLQVGKKNFITISHQPARPHMWCTSFATLVQPATFMRHNLLWSRKSMRRIW